MIDIRMTNYRARTVTVEARVTAVAPRSSRETTLGTRTDTARRNVCCLIFATLLLLGPALPPVSYTHLTLPTNREV